MITNNVKWRKCNDVKYWKLILDEHQHKVTLTIRVGSVQLAWQVRRH